MPPIISTPINDAVMSPCQPEASTPPCPSPTFMFRKNINPPRIWMANALNRKLREYRRKPTYSVTTPATAQAMAV